MHPYHRPPSLPGSPPDDGDDTLSLVRLIENGTLDLQLAALLWLTLVNRGSIIVAASPRLAGKTTLLTALTDLMPHRFETVYTHGVAEEFDFLERTAPDRTLIVVNEISDHLPIYLWGSHVGRVLEALERGYTLAATMHADTPEEVLEVLLHPALGTTTTTVGNVTLIVTLLPAGLGGLEPVRRVRAAHLVLPPAAPPPRVRPLAEWDRTRDAFSHAGRTDREVLAERLGMSAAEFDAELAGRRSALEALLGVAPSTRETVRAALRGFARP